ncbi:MAG: hypothetical protein M1824_002210 [Vezdaea acicularis]|nr:MAG: hypothetical protein M1824_002210 [Vezdaea acicularis]
MSEEFKKYPMMTAKSLRSRRERPRRVKMLTRDFIEGLRNPPYYLTQCSKLMVWGAIDSLYNPHYGYFSTQATIFSPGEPFNFNDLSDEPAFHRALGDRYTTFEDNLDAIAYDPTRQLWHTPTSLFRPYYGEAVARYLVTNYKLTQYPYHDLIIYEMGAGNGELMQNVLDYIQVYHPDIYERTRYKVIEISSSLAELQRKASQNYPGKVEIVNQSIFSWSSYTPQPCFFLALEVFDNFPHDSVRYHPNSNAPLQGHVLIDSSGDFYEFYLPNLDPLASSYLQTRAQVCSHGSYSSTLIPPLRKRIAQLLTPFAPNLTEAEYIPTKLLQFFNILADYFPAHKLLAADFHSLPDTIAGTNAPVVQTRYERKTICVSTPFVQQGFFDILFPTPFDQVSAIYSAVTGKLTRVLSHEEYLSRWAYVEDTQTRNGENPLLSWYRNASVLTTI